MQAYAKKRLRDHDAERMRNYEHAQLVSFAFHNPKKMPDFTPTREPVKRDPAIDEARMKAFFMTLSKGA